MKPKKKNAFLTFCFSFVPGAAEMYSGFMRNGISLLLVFVLSFMIPALIRVNDVLMAFGFVVYVYAFFHARNLASATQEEFDTFQDCWIWDEFFDRQVIRIRPVIARKTMAIILILVGVSFFWSNIRRFFSDFLPASVWEDVYPYFEYFPGVLISIAIIVAGVLLIVGKKELMQEETQEVKMQEEQSQDVQPQIVDKEA